MLSVRDVSLAIAGRQVLDRVWLDVAFRDVVALVGPSGSGKTTLLKVIAGLLRPDSGNIVLDGRDLADVPAHRRGIGMVFQDNQLFPHRSVAANIGFGLKMEGMPRAERRKRVDEMLELVELSGFGDRSVTALSGGEAKRIALARTLAPAPRVVLLDEPLTGLDASLRDRVAHDVAAVLRHTGATAIIVTHDAEEAQMLADRRVSLADTSGIDLLDRPVEAWEVVRVPASATHELRRRVLRAGMATQDVDFAEDRLAGTEHLAIRPSAGGPLTAVSSWIPRELASRPGVGAVQLRGMATADGLRGTGLGGMLLRAGCTRARAGGAVLVWANARDAALPFYLRHGFQVLGDGFVEPVTGLPHHVVVCDL